MGLHLGGSLLRRDLGDDWFPSDATKEERGPVSSTGRRVGGLQQCVFLRRAAAGRDRNLGGHCRPGSATFHHQCLDFRQNVLYMFCK
jgi:hypothetical protein